MVDFREAELRDMVPYMIAFIDSMETGNLTFQANLDGYILTYSKELLEQVKTCDNYAVFDICIKGLRLLAKDLSDEVAMPLLDLLMRLEDFRSVMVDAVAKRLIDSFCQ